MKMIPHDFDDEYPPLQKNQTWINLLQICFFVLISQITYYNILSILNQYQHYHQAQFRYIHRVIKLTFIIYYLRLHHMNVINETTKTLNKKVVSIATMVRIRPLLQKQKGLKESIKSIDQKTIQIQLSEIKRRQTVEKVFNTSCTQRQLFQNLGPIINQTKEGFNVTLFTYGQTGSGKTYTMFGSDWHNIIENTSPQKNKQKTFLRSIQQDQNHAGIIPRIIHHVFSQVISKRRKFIKVFCSFLQIYNQNMTDLLESDLNSKKKLIIHQNKEDGIYVEGLNEIQVCDFDECVSQMQKGQRNRIVRQTNMNIKSSRSHTIFQLLIQEVYPNTKTFRRTKINLCDLAGSEKINKSQKMQNEHFQELRNINLSLTTLGKVISGLATKDSYPQYRDSKLTRLLQDSLGGNAHTAIIATITTKSSCIQQSINTLKFLERAKQIKTEIINKIFNENSQMRNLQKEISYLKDILKLKRNGVSVDFNVNEELKKLQAENEKLKQIVDKDLVDKLTKQNNILKRQLQMKLNDDLTNSYLNNKTIQFVNKSPQKQYEDQKYEDQKFEDISEGPFKSAPSIQHKKHRQNSDRGKKFNKSYTNQEEGSTVTHKQAKTTIFPAITRNSNYSSRNPASQILGRIQEIQKMKKLNKSKLENQLILIDQRQSLDSNKTIGGKRSKYSAIQ